MFRMIRSPKTMAAVHAIRHLPLVERLLHPNARRPMVAMATGTVLMLVGSGVAAHRHELAEVIPVNHLLFDTLGYFIHGVGSIPLLRYVEPVWVLLMGTAAAE